MIEQSAAVTMTDIGALAAIVIGFVGLALQSAKSRNTIEKAVIAGDKELLEKINKIDKHLARLSVETRDVSKDHDKVVALGMRADKAERDINGQYVKIREVESNVGSFISTFRKG